MKNVWSQRGAVFQIAEVGHQVEKLPVGVFKLEKDQFDTLYLVKTQEKFKFPYKVYGVEKPFIDRVLRTYKHTKSDLGILLNGVKGTGKTVTAELLANEMNLPIITITDFFDGTTSFINSLQQDVVIIFDEYEKVYEGYEHDILTVMDGVLSTEHRKMYILTTNHLYLSENLLQRPGRIRYVKTFADLELPIIEEIVDDMLINEELRDSIITFISELEIITIDIIKAIVNECNIHNETPDKFKDVFNVKAASNLFDVYMIEDGTKELIASQASISIKRVSDAYIGRNFTVNNNFKGRIIKILDKESIQVAHPHHKENGKPALFTYVITESAYRHIAFHNLVV